jgi:dihydroxyacetone kinase-like protein
MLAAACPGAVFAAPPMDYVYETTKRLNSPKGVVHLINNYTGDRMAFDMGREMAEDINVQTLLIDDDVSVKDSTYTVGRRGVAGNFFVIKAVGAAAEEGAELDDLVTLGNRVNAVTRTMGMALTACTPPAKGSPLFELGADEMEMGVGIHGEPGRRREKLTNADAIIDELLEACVTDLPYQQGDEVALMINGLGGTPISELYILYGRAHQQLADRGITVRKNYVGEYCTSLDMAGASLTLVKLDDELVRLLEAPAESPSASSTRAGPPGDRREDRLVLLDAEHDLGGLDEHGHRPALGQAEALSRGTGDRRDDLLAIDVDDHLGHHRAEIDAPDGAGELVAGAELHGSSLVGSVGGTVRESTGGSRPTPRRPARPGRTSGLAAASGWWYQPPRMWSSHPLPGV